MTRRPHSKLRKKYGPLWVMHFIVISVSIYVSHLPVIEGQSAALKQSQEREDPNSPRRLLMSSYALERNLRPGDRTFLLTTDANTAATIDPEFCRSWSKELFSFALTLPPSALRVAAEKNALVALSEVDAKTAFEMFPRVDLPFPLSDGRLPEDVRTDAATTVFAEFWKHNKSSSDLADLRSQADKLGNTGQYPYLGIEPILEDVIKQDEAEGEAMFLQALSYYRRGSRIDREDDDFREFIDATWHALPIQLRRAALSASVERLINESKPRDGEVFSGKCAEVWKRRETIRGQSANGFV